MVSPESSIGEYGADQPPFRVTSSDCADSPEGSGPTAAGTWTDPRDLREPEQLAPAGLQPGSPPPRLSLVVLPFANIGGDHDQEYFADGITESLTTDLSRISGAFVIARSTAFAYKTKRIDLRQIGRDLNVRYALEGSVQRGGDRKSTRLNSSHIQKSRMPSSA